MAVPYCTDYHKCVIYLEIGTFDVPSFVLYQDCFSYWGSLWFLMNFRIVLSTSLKNARKFQIRIILKL